MRGSAPLSGDTRAERSRCRSLVQRLMVKVRDTEGPGPLELDHVRVLLVQLDADIRYGKHPTLPPRWNSKRVCSYCEGEEEPKGHNRARCPRRFRDIAAGKAAA